MMGKVSAALIRFFAKWNWLQIEDDGQFDCYVYILYTQLLRWTLWIGILSLSLATHRTGESILFLLAFSWMRRVSGGYHSPSAGKCFLLSLASYGALLLIFQLPTAWWNGIIAVLALTSFLLLFRFAPQPHANDPKSDEEKRTLRRYSILSCLGISAMLGVGRFMLPALQSYRMAIAMGMGISGISLLLSYITESKGSSKNEEEKLTAKEI